MTIFSRIFLLLICLSAKASLRQAENIDSMKNRSGLSSGDFCFVGGYYTLGDGGGGTFVYQSTSTQPDDGGRCIAPKLLPGRWFRILNGARSNVKMWGAKGDGWSDDADAFRRAVKACRYGWSMELVVPSGSFGISDTVVFPSVLHITGEAIGNACMIRMLADKNFLVTENAAAALAGQPYDYDHWLNVEKLYIDLGYNSVSNAALTTCQPGEASLVSRLSINNGRYGVVCYGVGAPGLRMEYCSIGDPTEASIAIMGRLPNGTVMPQHGSVSFLGMSGDHARPKTDATATYLLIDQCFPTVLYQSFKSEGQWGGGYIRYNRGGVNGGGGAALGSLHVDTGTFNQTYTGGPMVPCDFIVLQSDDARTASVSVENVNLFGVRNLIRDELTGRNVLPDTQIGTGLNQTTCRLPVHYESVKTDPPRSRLVVGECARYDLFPPQTGWYRVMTQSLNKMGGRLVINSQMESTDLSFDAMVGGGETGAKITVNRASIDDDAQATPRVTQARAGSYRNAAGDSRAFLDILVSRLPKYQDECISLALPLEGGALRGSGMVQLLTPTNIVEALIPEGCILNQCVTNSLTR